MKKALIILGVSAVTAVVTKVVTSNVKKQKEEKGKFEFKGLFEKAAAKQATKDSVEAVKGISKEALSLIGLKALVEIFKANRKGFNKIAIEIGVLCGVSGILTTAMDRKKYESLENKKWLTIIKDAVMNIAHYLECVLFGSAIGWLIGCFRYKSFDSWISKIILETIIESIIGSILSLILVAPSNEVA